MVSDRGDNMQVCLGKVVYSKAGRDAGKKFIIVDIVDDNNVLISDGNLRRIEKAKPKKIKHLVITDKVLMTLNEKLKCGIRVSNSEIRKALQEIADMEYE
jgi:ribosomal protein L14E/L6E/L27E